VHRQPALRHVALLQRRGLRHLEERLHRGLLARLHWPPVLRYPEALLHPAPKRL